MIRAAFVLVVSYAFAAAISSHVSMNLAETEWLSLWVYLWWAVALPLVSGLFAVLMLAVFAILRLFQ